MIFNCKELSSKMRNNLKERFIPNDKKFLILHLNESLASQKYVGNNIKVCNEIGIQTHIYSDMSKDPKDVLEEIESMIENKEISSMIIQEPIEQKYRQVADYLINTYSQLDIDCISTKKQTELYVENNIDIENIPLTALGVLTIIENENIDVKGKVVTVVGIGRLSGKPIAHCLEQKGATVLRAHVDTKRDTLKQMCLMSDIVVGCCGVPHLVTEDMTKDSQLLINVGMGERDGQVYPDFDIENINENHDVKVTSLFSSTGLMTITSMLNKFINTNWERK